MDVSVQSQKSTEVSNRRRAGVLALLEGADTRLRQACLVVAGVFLVGLAGVVLYGIVARELLPGGQPVWTNEISDYLFIWCTFIGAAVSVRDHAEPNVVFVRERLKERTLTTVKQVIDGFALFAFVYLAYYGVAITHHVAGQTSPASGLPVSFVAAAVPCGGVLMAAFKFSEIVRRRSVTALVVAAIVVGGGMAAVGVHGVLGSGAFFPMAIGGLLVLLAFGLPIGESLLVAGILGWSLTSAYASNLSYVQSLFEGLNDFTFVAIPLFLLTGALVAHTGSARKLAQFSRSVVGWMPGGLAVADIGASAVFADISGSAVADTVALSSGVIPEMVEEGYPLPFAAGLQASAGTLGVLFPPSISTLIYASVANVSVSRMFAALLLPGLLVAATFALAASVLAWRHGWGQRQSFGLRALASSGRAATPALLVVVIVLGGIFSGIFTATEAGAVAAGYMGLVGVAGNRRRAGEMARTAIVDAVRYTGRVCFIIGAALAFGGVLVLKNGPQELVSALGGIGHGRLVMLIVVLAGLIIVNTVLEPSTTPLVVVPILIPLLTKFRESLVHFGVMLQLDAAIALLLPPLGLCLFLVASVAKVKMESAARWAVPFIGVLVVDLGIVLLVPGFTTWLPNLMGVK